jgi:hypothetical protein
MHMEVAACYDCAVQLVCTSTALNECFPHDGIKTDEREEFEQQRVQSLEVAQQLISGEISLALWGIDPCKQCEADAALE